MAGDALAFSPQAVRRWQGGAWQDVGDHLAQEVPVALVFNGISHAVMLATPADLEDFALGFSLTEGVLAHPGELYGVEAREVPGQGIQLDLEVSAACMARLKAYRRTLAGRTGCGLCGTDSLAQVRRALPPLPALQVAPQAIAAAMQALHAHQPLQTRTGATHAAAWCDARGVIVLAREDVGRHNALDKLIGALRRAQQDAASGFIVVTSRASFEMVQKTALAGCSMLVAVSAPTALAVQVAQQAGLALAGFARDDHFVAYAHAHRFC